MPRSTPSRMPAQHVAGLTQAFVMLTGISGDADQVDAGSAAYVLAFLLAAAGFGILATSHANRAGLSTRLKVIGACGAPPRAGKCPRDPAGNPQGGGHALGLGPHQVEVASSGGRTRR